MTKEDIREKVSFGGKRGEGSEMGGIPRFPLSLSLSLARGGAGPSRFPGGLQDRLASLA